MSGEDTPWWYEADAIAELRRDAAIEAGLEPDDVDPPDEWDDDDYREPEPGWFPGWMMDVPEP